MMNEKTILVIDDSTTIRRLVDRELANAGYRVLLAENAERGIEAARSEKPDLILLDHQLPGTTGFNLCGLLLQDAALRTIPVVVSSTLRKKAYVEYTDCSNVVDMLPKPYTGDLLRTTVANALDTAALIVQSQSAGTAVPEVMEMCGDSDLVGTFATFGVRELIDFLTNGSKHGLLELDCERSRICLFLDKGRIQAVTGSGVSPAEVADQLPPALADLAPMAKFTLAGRQGAQLDGLVELLDNKVLDARLLRQLLRHQAAVLLLRCFRKTPKGFRFDARQSAPALFTKLPLDISLAALLVDAAMLSPPSDPNPGTIEYSRRAIRGQNLDRAGLGGAHMKLLSSLNSPMTAEELSALTGCSIEETQGVLHGFELAELVSRQPRSQQHKVIALSADAEKTARIAEFLRLHQTEVHGKVVRDALAVKLLVRRSKPSALIFDLDQANQIALCKQMQSEFRSQLGDAKWFGVSQDARVKLDGLKLDGLLSWERFEEDFRSRLNLDEPLPKPTAPAKELADCV